MEEVSFFGYVSIAEIRLIYGYPDSFFQKTANKEEEGILDVRKHPSKSGAWSSFVFHSSRFARG
jgi:hypothetical protein